MTEDVVSRDLSALEAKLAALEADHRANREHLATMEALHQVAQSLISELNLTPLLHKILAAAVEVVHGSAGSLLLLDEDNDELVFAVIEGGAGQDLEGQRLARDQGIAGWVASHRQPLIVNDVHSDDRHYQAISRKFHTDVTSLLCVPMLVRGRLIGVIQVLNEKPGCYFSQQDQTTLSTFAAQSAIAIENARLYESVRAERDRLIAVEEQVRKRLALDLHDGPAQLLSAIIMNINFCQELRRRSSPGADEAIADTMALAEKALHQVRTLLFDLRPVILEAEGLIPALEVYVEQLQKNESFEIDLQISGCINRLSHNAESTVFSIVQEAINNAKKHAQADNLRISVEQVGDTLSITVEDNGVGFDVSSVQKAYAQRGSLGLLTMHERADIVNGTFNITSRPGEGTRVELQLPLSANPAEVVSHAA